MSTDKRSVVDHEQLFAITRGTEHDGFTMAEIRNLVQNVLRVSVNVSTLLGSGASTPAIPLMGQTFKEFRTKLKEGDHLFESSLKEIPSLPTTVETYISQLCDDGKPEDYGDIESFLSMIRSRIDGGVEETKKEDKEIWKLLVDYFAHSITKAEIDSTLDKVDSSSGSVNNYEQTAENYKRMIQGLGESRQVLALEQRQGLFNGINLFTTNYDLFHEHAIEESRYAYTDGFTNGTVNRFSLQEFHRRPIDLDDRFRDHIQPVNPFFRLYKLHGSINWRKNKEGKILRIIMDSVPDDTQEVLIAPTTSKYALTQNSPYSDLFREFVDILGKPNSVLFTNGFSYGDEHIANLISEALNRPDFTLYAFIKKPEENSTMQKFIENNRSMNAFFIYPQDTGYFSFQDFASCIQPNTLQESTKDSTSMDSEKGE
ncbi:SIR2 family protein [Bifidobacterium sp. ESL0798]|uniref:SIR2 family protein n=1 Tax=Bifidobacterium sp. ESL0798 TaxID=2983235 RepID=UPI0023F69359|nr:SIR2 family protein [Bifidobacterium sp. ESL0798]WEV74496.1 SIR2 family protein [Bifidobacterium sp. ESL0798]